MTIEPLELDGVVYDKNMVRSLRDELIRLRDQALLSTDFAVTIELSHIIAVLQHYIDNLSQ